MIRSIHEGHLLCHHVVAIRLLQQLAHGVLGIPSPQQGIGLVVAHFLQVAQAGVDVFHHQARRIRLGGDAAVRVVAHSLIVCANSARLASRRPAINCGSIPWPVM